MAHLGVTDQEEYTQDRVAGEFRSSRKGFLWESCGMTEEEVEYDYT